MLKLRNLFKIKTVKNKISVLSGICLLVTVLAIVAYSAIQTGDEAVKEAKINVKNLANIEAGKIKTKMDHFLSIGRGLSQALAVNLNPDLDLKLTRKQADEIIKSVLVANPETMGIIIGWEENAFDGRDSEFINAPGHDETGRYVTFWFIDENGDFALEPLPSYRLLEKDQYGVAKGDYYDVPEKSRKEYVSDAYTFPAGNIDRKMELGISPTSPIIYNGKFYGVCGVDVHANFLQGLADKITAFDGQAKMTLVGPNGILAGVTGNSDLNGKHISGVN